MDSIGGSALKISCSAMCRICSTEERFFAPVWQGVSISAVSVAIAGSRSASLAFAAATRSLQKRRSAS